VALTDVGDRIRNFILTEIMFGDSGTALEDDTPLLKGVLDSLALMQLISFIEQEFDIEVDDEEVTANNFMNVADIEKFISQKASVG
jgi:acyl carrier protein